jgi:hypothetical protein
VGEDDPEEPHHDRTDHDGRAQDLHRRVPPAAFPANKPSDPRAGHRGPGADAKKKSTHAAEQERPDVKARRAAWPAQRAGVPPERLLFLDETWASTAMTRTYGRCPRGERLPMPVPCGHWKTTTFVAALRCSGLFAPTVVDGAMNGVTFEAYVRQQLVRELRPGDVVVMDNLSAH